jgi:hypothetical protein
VEDTASGGGRALIAFLRRGDRPLTLPRKVGGRTTADARGSGEPLAIPGGRRQWFRSRWPARRAAGRKVLVIGWRRSGRQAEGLPLPEHQVGPARRIETWYRRTGRATSFCRLGQPPAIPQPWVDLAAAPATHPGGHGRRRYRARQFHRLYGGARFPGDRRPEVARNWSASQLAGRAFPAVFAMHTTPWTPRGQSASATSASGRSGQQAGGGGRSGGGDRRHAGRSATCMPGAGEWSGRAGVLAKALQAAAGPAR